VATLQPQRAEAAKQVISMHQIKRFQIKGLFGSRNVDLVPKNGALILVGPNGIGKSSVINILYFFISRQWSRLLEFKFNEIILNVGNEEIVAKRAEISGLFDLRKIVSEMPPSSRARQLFDKLTSVGLLEEFVNTRRMNLSARNRFAELLNVSPEEILNFQRYLVRRSAPEEGDLFSAPRVSIEKTLVEQFPSRALYLPTYRRIEKDLRDIFPDFEERYRSHTNPESFMKTGRSSSHYIDLVSFGMEDVRKNFETRTREMRDYSLEQYNNLSALYLRDVIRGTADRFTTKEINFLTDERISEILNRVSEATLPAIDKNLLLEKVRAIQGKKKSEIAVNDRFLAHYFTRLVSVNADIAKREQDITSFVDVCNAYLSPGKGLVYDEIGFKISVVDGNSPFHGVVFGCTRHG
jgi:predicted ATPase